MSLNLYLALTSISYDLDQVNHWSSQHPWLQKELSILHDLQNSTPLFLKKTFVRQNSAEVQAVMNSHYIKLLWECLF